MGAQVEGVERQEERRIELDGDVYELRDWQVEDGLRWLFRLARLIAPMLGDDPAALSQGAMVGTALAGLTEAQFLEFLNLCIQHTMIVGRDARGAETILPFSGEANLALRRRYHVAIALAAAHGRRQYAGFFERLPALLLGLGIAPKAKAG